MSQGGRKTRLLSLLKVLESCSSVAIKTNAEHRPAFGLAVHVLGYRQAEGSVLKPLIIPG